ncbi:MAG TPA: ASCH domain-containing protein, partial [Candidatus Baltobacteraceae bacterium]|nr:ASCH domain-containing protein [Candidatus Baltobacteraceae bacterium]
PIHSSHPFTKKVMLSPDMANNHALLLSIRPRFADLIFSGKKTVELRRVKPRVQAGDLVVIYASGATKGMVGAFEVADVVAAAPNSIWRKYNGGSGLTKREFDRYFANISVGYAIRIRKFWKIQEPVSLKILRKRRAGFRPPQSYHYWKLNELLQISGEALSSRLKSRIPISEPRLN